MSIAGAGDSCMTDLVGRSGFKSGAVRCHRRVQCPTGLCPFDLQGQGSKKLLEQI